jgi:teichuronic acid biosynthesis glycosyltransferase TuaG
LPGEPLLADIEKKAVVIGTNKAIAKESVNICFKVESTGLDPMANPFVSVVISHRDRISALDKILTAYERQSYRNMELIVVDDNSRSTQYLENVISRHTVRFFAIPFKHTYFRKWFCHNFGAARARGEIFVFSDVDVIARTDAVEKMAYVHSENDNLVICGRVWKLLAGLESSETVDISRTEELRARVSESMYYDPVIQWSTVSSVQRSGLWWNFLSTFCSFRREDFLYLLGWDPQLFGWGHDQEMSYRILKHGLDIAFFEDIEGFHLDHPVSPARNATSLRNFSYITRKFPELDHYAPLVQERNQFIEATGTSAVNLKDPLRVKSQPSNLERFLEHPALYARTLLRRREPDEGLVTVMVPSRNCAAHLRSAVLSSIYQTRPPLEVYILEDPSDDGTDAIADELSKRYGEVRWILNDKDRGDAELRNQGIVAAASHYILFLEPYAELNPWYIEKLAKVLDRNSDVGVAYSDYEEVGQQRRLVKLPTFNPRSLLIDCIVGPGVAIVRRHALEEAGGFDGRQILGNWELFLRLVENKWQVVQVREPLYSYRIHPRSAYALTEVRRKEGEDMIYDKHRSLYNHYGIGRTTEHWSSFDVRRWVDRKQSHYYDTT